MTTISDHLDSGLHTLCYRINPDTLGSLVLYPLTAEFLTAWDGFARLVKARANRDEISPSYSALATALIAATNTPVRLFPRNQLSKEDTTSGVAALLVTTNVIDPWIMTNALRRFEQLSTADQTADTLAPLLTSVEPRIRPVREFISTDPDTGVVRAPGWLFDAARWNLAARIAAAPLVIDGNRPITLRLDTDGHLVAFNHPLTRASKNTVGHATIHISTKIITVPGATGLYLWLDGHVARHPYTWNFVKTSGSIVATGLCLSSSCPSCRPTRPKDAMRRRSRATPRRSSSPAASTPSPCPASSEPHQDQCGPSGNPASTPSVRDLACDSSTNSVNTPPANLALLRCATPKPRSPSHRTSPGQFHPTYLTMRSPQPESSTCASCASMRPPPYGDA